MDIYEQELTELKEKGLLRSLSLNEGERVNFSSNDYLGLARHPQVIEAAVQAVKRFGAGGTSSRLLSGTFKLHAELETKLAAFLGKEAALVFSSGYHANTGIIPVIAGASDVVFFDRLVHASIIDGVKLSGARFYSFQHNDVDDLEKKLKKNRPEKRRAWILTEGIFSMDGDRAALPGLVALAKKYDAMTYVDEAHAIGLFGDHGQGAAAGQNMLEKIDVIVGTLSKTLGTQGGFVACGRSLKELLISKSRAFIYTTALAPACAGAALAALDVMNKEPRRGATVLEAAERLRAGLRAKGFDCMASVSQIVPIWTGNVESTRKLSSHLLSKGFFVPSIRPPTVPIGQGRLRLSVTYEIVSEIERLLDAVQNQGEQIVQTR